MNRRAALLCVALLTATSAVAGCGKKPKFVDPPQGRDNDVFPRTYPAPADGSAAKRPAPTAPNLGPPDAGTSPDDPVSPFPSTGGVRFP